MEVTVVEGPVEQTLDNPPHQGPAPTPLTPGRMLGRYQLLTRIGEGGMGSVFTAHDPDLDRTVAIKLLHAGIDDQRLEREARGLAKVSHPNVIAVYDVGRAEGRLFLAMEFVQGLTLRKWLASAKRSLDAILGVFTQAGRGLEAAHAAGLVHRDFKPDNVLLGYDGRVRVLDFGLVDGVSGPSVPAPTIEPQSPSYDYDSASGAARLTANGSLLGTPAYMALEQYSGATPDPRTDQYSYCVALWEALYGRRPYDYTSVLELLARLRSGPPPEAPRDSDVPSWLERLLRRGLSRQADSRFSSMGELLERVETSVDRTRAREALIGFRYRPIGAADDGLSAIDTFTDQQVVLKRATNVLDFELLGSFEHPNLVPIVDVATSFGDGVRYLVLDLTQPRKTFVEAAQSAPLAIQLEWSSELLRALHYLHHRKLGHARLSLDDVLIVGGRVRLLVTQLEAFEPELMVARGLALAGALLRQLSSPSPALEALAVDLEGPRAGSAILDAAAALKALARASDRSFPVENAETRESLLRAIPLLGRGEVTQTLSEALGRLVAGRGSAFWLEGESGIGKSRLLEEVRRAALARGVFVLEGRGEASTRSPYRVFRLPLLRLVLRAGSEALDDFQLETLAPLIPELPPRLGRALETIAAEAEPSRDALKAVILALIRQEREPLLLLLEDLHWSGSESFALLTELVALTETRPLMILVSCRSAERAAHWVLPEAMHTVDLPRLTAAHIAVACSELIGSNQPAPPELVSLLLRETEGNAFFLVEALRALAEEAGSLSALKSAALPARIFAGGIQTLVRRHLSAVSERGRPLLQAAAVLGRGMDPAVLQVLAPDADIDAWLAECVSAAVLERVEGGRDVNFRFRHDKLREALLDELSGDERRALHARVAAALEQTRADDPEQLAPLARHFQAAGNEVKELVFATKAGEQALRGRAYSEAADFLERATELAERVQRRDLLPQLCSLRAELYSERSEWNLAQAEIAAAFSAAGRPLWEKKLGNGFFLLVQLLVHLARSVWPAQLGQAAGKRGEASSALIRAADVQLNVALTRGDNLLALTSSLMALNVSGRGQNTSVRALLLLALAARVARLRGVTRRYIARANALLPLTTDRKDRAEALSYFGYYWIGEGKLGRARDYLFKSIETSTSIGYQLPLSWSVGQLSMCASLQGRFVEMLQQAEACERHAALGDPTHVAAQCTQILALLRLGRLEEASERRASLSGPLPADSPLISAIRAATTAAWELERGHLPEALALANSAHRVLPWVSQVPPVWPYVLTAPIEVYLRAWQDTRSVHASRLARRRIRALQGWARIYPVARPIADYFSAEAAWLSGREAEAAGLYQRAHDGARARGLAHYERLSAEALATRCRPRQISAM